MSGSRKFEIVMFVVAACFVIAGIALALPAANHGHSNSSQANAGYTLMAIAAVIACLGAIPFILRARSKAQKSPPPQIDQSWTQGGIDPTTARAAGVQQQIQQQQAEVAQQVQRLHENQ